MVMSATAQASRGDALLAPRFKRRSISADPGCTSTHCFLPNFCEARVILRVVVISELLAFVLALDGAGGLVEFWNALGRKSLMIQWIVLWDVLILCLLRSLLQRMQVVGTVVTTCAVSLAVTFAVSLGATQLLGLGDAAGFVARNLVIAAIVTAVVLRYFYVQHEWKRNIEAEARTRIQALQARIRPHFLFNSMNTIASLTRTDPERAEQAVEDLADLFRASLGQGEKIALSEELDFTRRYINIEELRLGERLRVEWTIDPKVPDGAAIPALLLQPLVENAIYHGIEPQTEGGKVRIDIRRDGDRIEFTITNPIPTTLSNYRRSGNKMALENIQQRLRLTYGAGSELRIRKTEDTYEVRFSIPVEGLS
jgi:two-component system sensor histidine kinase AlgZ